jgi:hypothetical protein
MTDVNLGRASETSNDIRDIPLIFVKAHSAAANESNQHYWTGRAGRGRPRHPTRRDRVMPITICRLYDSYADANRVVLALEAAGVRPSETSVISNNSDTWYKANKTAGPLPQGKDDASGEGSGKAEGAVLGAAIGATAATAASLVTMLAIPGVGAVVGTGWLAAMLGSMAIGGVAGGLLGALSNAGISEEDAQVFVEGVRRGGTLVAARVPQAQLPQVAPMMNRSAVNLQERSDLYRKSGWQSFDPDAVPYTADQVRSERALHTQ